MSSLITSSFVLVHVFLLTISDFRVGGHSDHRLEDGDISDLKVKYTAEANQEMGENDISAEESLQVQHYIEKLNFMISPEDFFQQYASKRKPVLVKNVIQYWPAYSLWSEGYLSEKFEDVTLTVVDQKQNDVKEMTMKEFLEKYKKDSLKFSQDLIPPLKTDITMPTCLRCAGLYQEVKSHMEMSSGRSTSSLHVEDHEMLLCALRGNQTVTLVSPMQSKNLYADEGDPVGTSPVDFIASNLGDFPRASSSQSLSFDMHEGDILYIPQLWWQQTSLKEGQHLVVKISWTLNRGNILVKDLGTERSKYQRGKMSFGDALIQYEELMLDIGRSVERPRCRDQDSFMSDYTFESSREETHDGPDLTEDEACYFDDHHHLSPCQLSGDSCDGKENELKCAKYVLDYCYAWEDRGCVVDLPQSLNRISNYDLEELQHLQYHFGP